MNAQSGFSPHVAEFGSGSRKVLALHCTLAFSGAWRGLGKAMADKVTLIAPDMPSHGASVDWDGKSSFVDTVYQGALSCLQEPMDVIGHSFGAATALRLAVEHPELVRSLTVIEPVMFCVAHMDQPASLEDHDRIMGSVYDSIMQGDHETAARSFNRMWSTSGPRWPEMRPDLRAAMIRAIGVLPSAKPFLIEDSENLVARLSRLSMPVLILHGSETMDVVKVTNQGLADRIKGASLVELPGAGHMVPISHPREVAKHWTGVLERADASA